MPGALADDAISNQQGFQDMKSRLHQMLINRMNKTNEPPATEIVDSIPKGAKKVKPKLSTS